MAEPTTAAPLAKTVRPEEWTQAAGKERLEKLSPLVLGTINKALPKFMAGSAERLVRCAITSVLANDKLLKCSPISIYAGVTAAAQLGLEIGGPRGEAYLVPYSGNATLQIGYKGFLQLGYRSGQLKVCAPVDVRANDVFKVFGGADRRIVHEPFQGPASKAGKVVAYYCITELVNGGKDFEYWYVEDALQFRDQYSAGRAYKKGPWYEPGWKEPGGEPSQEFNEMAKKSLIRKLFKRLPISAEAQAAANLDEYAELGISQRLPETYMPEIPLEPTATEQLESKLESRKPAAKKEQAEAQPTPTPTPSAPGRSPIAVLLDQIDRENQDMGAFTAQWIRDTGYEGLDQIEALSPGKQAKLKEALQKIVRDLGVEPAV